MKVLRCGDQYNWAYDFISREHKRYSIHGISYCKHDEVNLEGVDVIYIHSPDISKFHANELPLIAKEKGIKVIGGYAGNPNFWSIYESKVYTYADLIVTISPQLYQFAKNMYPETPVVYLPESVDTKFFYPYNNPKESKFTIGWAGGAHKKIKRCHMLDKLNYKVNLRSDWAKQREANNTGELVDHAGMRDFYNSIDCLVVTSASECMPRVVMEAMACGCAVVSTDVGSIRLMIEPELIVPINPEVEAIRQMNSCLRHLADDLSYLNEVKGRNLKHVKTWLSWANNAIIWDSVFKAVYEGKLNEAEEIASNWLHTFKPQFDYTIKYSKEHSLGTLEEQYVAVINYLNSRGLNYFAVHTTCLDIIRYAGLKIDKETMYLATNNLDDYYLIIKEFEKIQMNNKGDLWYKGNINVKLKMLKNIVNVKVMPFYNSSIKVPNPVVGYLKDKFGKNWQTI